MVMAGVKIIIRFRFRVRLLLAFGVMLQLIVGVVFALFVLLRLVLV
jgi:hypothetical protein